MLSSPEVTRQIGRQAEFPMNPNQILPVAGILFAVLVAVLLMLTTKRRRRNLLLPLVHLLDEGSGEVIEKFLYQMAQLDGHFRGRAVTLSVTQGGKNRPSEFRIKFSCLAPLAFDVKKELKGDTVLKALHLEKDVEVGDPELDRQFVFSCKEPERLASWVRRGEVQERLVSLMFSRKVNSLRLRDHSLDSIFLNYTTANLNLENLRTTLEDTLALAGSLESTFGTSAPPL